MDAESPERGNDLMEEDQEKITNPELRADVLFPKTYDTYLNLDSELLFEEKPSDDNRIESEGQNIFNSRKTREYLYEQAIQKIRWRLSHDNKLSSNSKLVKWSDGTYGIYIGSDYYDLNGASPGNKILYLAQNTGDNLMVSVAPVNYHSGLKKRTDLLRKNPA